MANRQDAVGSSKSGGLFSGGLAVGTGLFRLVPHLPNFTPVGALGLFAGARMKLWQALTVPLIVMAVSEGTYTDIAGWTSEPVGLGTTIVFVRENGQWRARHAHQSIAP